MSDDRYRRRKHSLVVSEHLLEDPLVLDERHVCRDVTNDTNRLRVGDVSTTNETLGELLFVRSEERRHQRVRARGAKLSTHQKVRLRERRESLDAQRSRVDRRVVEREVVLVPDEVPERKLLPHREGLVNLKRGKINDV